MRKLELSLDDIRSILNEDSLNDIRGVIRRHERELSSRIDDLKRKRDMLHVGGMVAPGSSDLGDVSYVCPSIQVAFDICEGKHYDAHTPEFAECAGTDQAMERGLIYVKGFALTAIELMTEKSNLKKIQEEFKHINDSDPLSQ